MGLFIGASILTILELFDYAYEVSHAIETKQGEEAWSDLNYRFFSGGTRQTIGPHESRGRGGGSPRGCGKCAL